MNRLKPTMMFLAALGLAGCAAGDGGPPGPAHRGGKLLIDAPQLAQFRSFDPIRVTDINTSSIAGAIYEGLLGYAPAGEEAFQPLLAESWGVSEDGLEWTFRLREGVRFHDDPCFPGGRGRAVTVEDVRYSLLRSLQEGEHTAPLSLDHLVEGADAFRSGTTGDVAGIEILDDHALRFRLLRPSSAFLHTLATSAGWVIPREAIEQYGANFDRHPVGTGPFRFASWSTTSLVLVRNEHYWRTDAEGEPLPYLDSIVMQRRKFGDYGRMTLAELLGGSFHLLYFTGELEWRQIDDLKEFMEERGIRVVRTAKLNNIFYGWDMARDTVWTQDARLRRVVSLAVRRPDSNELLIPAAGLLPPGLPDCVAAADPVGQDLDRARELLREAGYPDGRGLPPLQLGALGQTPFLIRSVLAPLKALGIEIRVETAPWDMHWEALERGGYEFFRDGWIADYPDAENFFSLFYSGSPVNHTHFASPEYDRLFKQLQGTHVGDESRQEICTQLEKILRDEIPAIFLYHEQSFYFVRPELRNIDASINPFERKFYELVWLDPGPAP